MFKKKTTIYSNKMNTLNPSIKHHTVIGVLLSIWGFLFGFFARPFEHGNMDLEIWIYVTVGFSILIFLSYTVVIGYQKIVHQKLRRWSTILEISTYFIFYLLYAVSTYAYYMSPFVKGVYGFPEFLTKIIFNIILIMTPLLFAARRYSIKLIPSKSDDIIIKGDNKLDILKIKQSELICISNSQNYVEIFFLEKDQLKTKLIRSSLKKIQSDFDFLIQTHRSHLINPSHFKSWKDSNTISLTQIEIPVSKNYKNSLLSL